MFLNHIFAITNELFFKDLDDFLYWMIIIKFKLFFVYLFIFSINLHFNYFNFNYFLTSIAKIYFGLISSYNLKVQLSF